MSNSHSELNENFEQKIACGVYTENNSLTRKNENTQNLFEKGKFRNEKTFLVNLKNFGL